MRKWKRGMKGGSEGNNWKKWKNFEETKEGGKEPRKRGMDLLRLGLNACGGLRKSY